MTFDNIRTELIQKNVKDYTHQKDKIGTEKEKEVLTWCLNRKEPYAGTKEQQKEKMIKALTKKYIKKLSVEITNLEEIEQSEDFNGHLTLTIEWKRSTMWGLNPKGFDNYGHKTRSIGGCGYDKLSTATAELLNQHPNVLKLLCEAKNKALETNPQAKNREIIAYGSGNCLIPRFEGGVGVSSHQQIFKKLGFEMHHVTSTPHTDVFTINKTEVVE